MKTDLEKYVFPLEGCTSENDLTIGVGVLVGHYFITAGHVIADMKDAHVNIDGKRLKLDKGTAVLFRYPDKEDIAAFKVEWAESPLKLANEEPVKGQKMNCVTFMQVTKKETKNDDGNLMSMFYNSPDPVLPLQCAAVVTHMKSGLFACDTDAQMQEGNSGSPVLDGDTVVGILIKGKPGTPLCVFQSASSIVKLLEEVK